MEQPLSDGDSDSMEEEELPSVDFRESCLFPQSRSLEAQIEGLSGVGGR